MKSILPFNHWEEKTTGEDGPTHLEEAAEKKHQKLQELKQVEFEQEMLIERERRVRQIESDMIDVNQIMRELSAMVQEQGDNISNYCTSSHLFIITTIFLVKLLSIFKKKKIH